MLTRLNSIEFPEFVHEALFSHDDRWLVANTDERLVWQFPFDALLDTKSTDQGTPIISATALTYDLEVSQDSKWVIASEREMNRAILFDQEARTTTLLSHNARVFGVALDSVNLQAATAGEDADIILWGLDDGEKRFILKNPSSVYAIAFDPQGENLAAGMLNRIVVWDLQTRKQLIELAQVGNIKSLTYSDDGKWLATASEDGTIYVWDAETGYNEEPTILRMNGQPLGLDFSPDSRWVAAGGSNTFAYLWDLTSGEEVSRLPHSEAVTSVSFSNDGQFLATVSRKTVQFWDIPALPLVPTAELITVACSHLTTNIGESEWELIFPGEAYRPICPDLK